MIVIVSNIFIETIFFFHRGIKLFFKGSLLDKFYQFILYNTIYWDIIQNICTSLFGQSVKCTVALLQQPQKILALTIFVSLLTILHIVIDHLRGDLVQFIYSVKYCNQLFFIILYFIYFIIVYYLYIVRNHLVFPRNM